MPTFAYSGRTRAGQAVAGERVAETIDAAVAALRREQIQVTRIDPAKAAKADAKAKTGKKGPVAPSKNLAIFTRQFSVMIDAGLPLVQCLDILGKQEPDKGFASVILQGPLISTPVWIAADSRPSIRNRAISLAACNNVAAKANTPSPNPTSTISLRS